MKRSTLAILAANLLVWGGMAWVGAGGLQGMETRIGHCNLGQVEFYLAFPLIMLSVSTLPVALLGASRWYGFGNAWSIFALLLLIPYGCVYGGGM